MVKPPSTTSTVFFNLSFRTLLPQVIVAIYLFVALGIFIAAPFLAAHWLTRPFLGGFIEPTLVFNATKPIDQNSQWAALNQGVKLGDEIISLDGKLVANTAELDNILNQYHFGQTINLTYQTPEGKKVTVPITLVEFPSGDRPGFIYIPYFIGLVFLLCSLWIFSIRHSQVSGQAFALFTASVAIAIGSNFDVYTTHQFTLLWSIAITIAGAAIIQLALTFPRTRQSIVRFPWLVYIGYLPALILSINTIYQLFNHIHPLNYIIAWRFEYIFTGIALLFYFAWNIFNCFTTESPIEREQARIILGGSLISFLPIGLWFIITLFTPRFGFYPILLFPIMVFPITTGYTIQRYRFLKTDYILSRIVLYGSMTILAAGGYALIVSGLSLLLFKPISPENPFLIGIFIFALALILNPGRERLQHSVDSIFFRGEQTLQEKVRSFSQELTRSVDITATIKLLRDYINQAFLPSHAHIFIFNSSTDEYIATADQNGQLTSDFRFASDSSLTKFLQEYKAPLFFDKLQSIPASLEKDCPRLALLAAQLYIPMHGRQRLAGWIALGPRRSAELYTSSDLHFLESLADQSAVAIERAQVVSNMERRVYEMNIVSRLALGINVTINFDDILELIYAQTNQVIPTVNFYLTLYHPGTKFFQYAFYMENDERILQKESSPVPFIQTLEQEIIRTRRPFLTNEYQNECRKMQISPLNPELKAWMGVPLNSGAETIGTISLASQDSSIFFSTDQLDLLQSIADQTAGAIVKARLLQESEQHAHQLTTLNEVTRQLTSTLETEPLLKKILQSAVDILNCEAGSLLLVDEQTDELVFRVTVGPVAEDLIGKRMASGSGVAGKSFSSRQPVLVNNVRSSNAWFSGTDNQTGFNTQSILATPLEVKNNAIGVVEVINRKDGLPFTSDDQSLLSAFASQAAVAFENARLYTHTDEALASRVEELSVMQRVDRELNTSLDITRAMSITLEWAMRQSKTNAGLVGIIEEQGIRIMASQGYTNEIDSYKESPIPISLQPFQSAIETGQLQQVMVFDQGDIRTPILINAYQQVAIPIRREASAIGIILLETIQTEPLQEETLSFLIRLSDHAAIAISNAQLFTAVQEANVAKSEFVSFVSHELKNPMTSIKGYTELLSAGAVGPVTEAQANFLTTIRSNVERMSTLVSDLTDVSRIEAGRLRLDFKPFPIFETAEEVIRSLRRQIDEKQQQLNLEIPSDLPEIWADRIRVNQVFTNLVNNASKYTPIGGQISVGAEYSRNQWDPDGPPEVVHVWVKDTGIGISPDDQTKIFQKFFRSDDPKTRESPGTGLGLNITKSLIEMQGGKIWFDSVFRQGTTFHFTIPVAS